MFPAPKFKLLSSTLKMARKACVLSTIVGSAFIATESSKAFAQFPKFGAADQGQLSNVSSGGVSISPVVLGTNQTVVMGVFANNHLKYTLAPDGKTFGTAVDLTAQYNLPAVDCVAALPSLCTPSIAFLGTRVYIAYVTTDQTVIVVRGTPVSGSSAFTWQLLASSGNIIATTSPAIVPYGNGLILIFGSSSDSNTKNAFFGMSYTEASGSFSNASEANLGGSSLRIASGARPGLAVIGSTIYLASQQNNTMRELYSYKSVDGVNWTYVKNTGSSQTIGGDIVMVPYNNGLLLANQQNSSASALYMFYSSDGGFSWTIGGYPTITMAQGPGLALFNGGLSVATKDKGNNVFTGYTGN